MILIKNGKFFIEGVETDNSELIGLALKDFVESNLSNQEEIYQVDIRYMDDSHFKDVVKEYL